MEEYHEHDQVFSKIDFPHLQQNEDHQNRGSPIKVKIEFRYTIKCKIGIIWENGTKTILDQIEKKRGATCSESNLNLLCDGDHTLMLVSPQLSSLKYPNNWHLPLANEISECAFHNLQGILANLRRPSVVFVPPGGVSAALPIIVDIVRDREKWFCVDCTNANIIREERKLAIKKMLEGFQAGDVGDDKGDCAVCLEGFSERKYRLCLPCLHVFHENCIVSWLLESTSCPLCRFEISL